MHDLEMDVGGMISKLVDETEIGGVVDGVESSQASECYENIGEWPEKWQMEFNPGKLE